MPFLGLKPTPDSTINKRKQRVFLPSKEYARYSGFIRFKCLFSYFEIFTLNEVTT